MGSIGEVQPRDVFFFPHVRTTSHVLCRLLSQQPGWTQTDNHFFRAFNFARDSFGWGPLAEVPEKKRKDFENLLQQGFDEIQNDREAAASKGQHLFLKEHTFYTWEPSKLSQSMWSGSGGPPFTVVEEESSSSSDSEKTNPTIFPDRFLKSFRPVFLIRHPGPTFESWYRAEKGGERPVDIKDKSWSFYTSFQYSRQLYHWFVSNSTDQSSMPIVIEADDMLEDGSAIKTLCDLIGMDRQHIAWQWDVIQTPDSATSRQLTYLSEYWGSTGIDSSKSSRRLYMAAKFTKWQDELGLDVATELWNLVEKAMPDYNHLRGRRFDYVVG